MAVLFSFTTEGEEALAAAATETVIAALGVAATQSKLCEWSVSFDGTSATAEPVLVELYQISTAGTSTGAVEVKWNRAGPTPQTTGLHSFTAEPTKGDRLASWECHAQGDRIHVQYPLGREPVISDGSTSQGIGAVVVTPSGVSPNVTGFMLVEE